MSNLAVDKIKNRLGSLTIPTDTVIYGAAKATVNFDGTGAIAVRDSFNVSSLTDNGTGDYTVNFTTSIPNANFVPQVTGRANASANLSIVCGLANSYSPVVGSVRVNCHLSSTGTFDMNYMMVSVDGAPV